MESGLTHEITFANFESTVDSHPIVIMDFWAAWCQPCKIFAPFFEEMAKIHPDIFFGKVDTETATDLAQAFLVRAIPTIMAFRNGDLVFEHPGLLTPPLFDQLVAKLREPAPPPATPPASAAP